MSNNAYKNAYPNVDEVYKRDYLDKLKDLADRVTERSIVMYTYPTTRYTVETAKDLDKELLTISESPYYKEMKNLPLSKQSEEFKKVENELRTNRIHTDINPGWSWVIKEPTSYGGIRYLIRTSRNNDGSPSRDRGDPSLYYEGLGGARSRKSRRKTRSRKTRRKNKKIE
jgi:hypothetical protein